MTQGLWVGNRRSLRNVRTRYCCKYCGHFDVCMQNRDTLVQVKERILIGVQNTLLGSAENKAAFDKAQEQEGLLKELRRTAEEIPINVSNTLKDKINEEVMRLETAAANAVSPCFAACNLIKKVLDDVL